MPVFNFSSFHLFQFPSNFFKYPVLYVFLFFLARVSHTKQKTVEEIRQESAVVFFIRLGICLGRCGTGRLKLLWEPEGGDEILMGHAELL